METPKNIWFNLIPMDTDYFSLFVVDYLKAPFRLTGIPKKYIAKIVMEMHDGDDVVLLQDAIPTEVVSVLYNDYRQSVDVIAEKVKKIDIYLDIRKIESDVLLEIEQLFRKIIKP